jgi:hypothetical protein
MLVVKLEEISVIVNNTVANHDQRSGSEIHEEKNLDPGSKINIPDPQHRY